MRVQDIVIGESYRFKDHPSYSYAKALQVLKPKEGVNTHTYSIVKCEHIVFKNDSFGFVRHFRPSALIKAVK